MKTQNVVVLSRSECSRRSADGGSSFFVPRLWKRKKKTIRFFHLPAAVLLCAVVWPVLGGGHALAYYTSNRTGNDISYPQCGTSALPQNAFGVIGVTDGRAFTSNACLSSEVAWASKLFGDPPSLYMNINAPIGPTGVKGETGPYGNCVDGALACLAENYGYKAAQYAFNYAASQNISSSMWWLDVEWDNSWAYSTYLNRVTIDGAVHFFSTQGLTVGIYSTSRMWRSITGGYINNLPSWFPIASMPPSIYCSTSYSFTGGPVYLVQYSSGGLDTDYAC
jgi:hypothetical protein